MNIININIDDIILLINNLNKELIINKYKITNNNIKLDGVYKNSPSFINANFYINDKIIIHFKDIYYGNINIITFKRFLYSFISKNEKNRDNNLYFNFDIDNLKIYVSYKQINNILILLNLINNTIDISLINIENNQIQIYY